MHALNQFAIKLVNLELYIYIFFFFLRKLTYLLFDVRELDTCQWETETSRMWLQFEILFDYHSLCVGLKTADLNWSIWNCGYVCFYFFQGYIYFLFMSLRLLALWKLLFAEDHFHKLTRRGTATDHPPVNWNTFVISQPKCNLVSPVLTGCS